MTFVPFTVFESNCTEIDTFQTKRSKKQVHVGESFKKPGALSLQLGPACLLSCFCHLVRHVVCRFLRPERFKRSKLRWQALLELVGLPWKFYPFSQEKLINSTCYSWLTLLPAYPWNPCPVVHSHLVKGPACPQQTVAFKAFSEQCEMLKVVTCFPQSTSSQMFPRYAGEFLP